MITVEIALDEHERCKGIVEIYFDKDGLADIQARLALIESGKADHIHLMSESWGLGDLDETKHRDHNLLVHHLQLSLLD